MFVRALAIFSVISVLGFTAQAQTTYFYGSSGQYEGSAQRYGGQTYFYGPSGQYQGNAQNYGAPQLQLPGRTAPYYGGPQLQVPGRIAPSYGAPQLDVPGRQYR